MNKDTKCSIESCKCMVLAKGYCRLHYVRLRKTGGPLKLKSKSRFGPSNPRWNGGEVKDSSGRVMIYSPLHPRPSYCGTHVYRYRLVMEKHLGRFLESNEHVHHINGDFTDDRLENLKVVTPSEHSKMHNQERTRNQLGQFNKLLY